MTALELVRHFEMTQHPEGGFYRETYRSDGLIPAKALPPAYAGDRVYSTAILFLLREGEYSHLHRIRQDEIWHFYLGGPLRLIMLDPQGAIQEVTLGQNVIHGEYLQYVVPAGVWFGATPLPGASFSLVGCTVAPGFDFADFELGLRAELESRFPQAQAVIREFC